MTGTTRTVAALVALLSSALVPALGAAGPTALPADDLGCAGPPCGNIWPTIGLEPDVSFPYLTSQLDSFPSEIHIAVTYKWDMQQDGTGPPGDADPMTITFALTKKPTWMEAALEPPMCEFTLIPVTTEYEVCTLTLTTTVTGYPMSEFEYEAAGKRLMVFATSRQSGVFQPSYGVEDMRFTWDGVPAGVTIPTGSTNEAPGLGLLPLGTLALAAVALRRRL